MDFLDERIDWQIKLIGTFILIFFYFEQFRKEGPIALVGCALVLLLYLVLVWTRKDWWNGIKYSAITAFIIAITLVLKYIFSVRSEDLLWPMVCILATVYGKYSRLSVILASFTILVILLMTSINPFPFANLLALVGVFVGLRSRKIRQDAYRMSHLHLQELNDAHKELQQAHAELQEASVHSMRYAALEERTRLAREIHDGLGHQLTSLIVQLQALEIMLPDDPIRASQTVTQLLDIARRAMAEVRMAVREWSDDEMGLGLVALMGLVSQTQARSSIQFHFVQDSEISEWPIETSVVLYRVLQESLTNIQRHSHATCVWVGIKEVNEQIVLSVRDNGSYTGDIPLTPGFGLKGIMERCRLHGGTCKITPEKPHGLRIEATVPIVPATTTKIL